jgi:PPOX class probable F420-dependent enzyme
MESMTTAEWREFLLFGTRTAKVATLRSNGHPHVAPVWFVLDGNELIFTTGKTSIKGKNLLRDPHVMLSVDNEQPPFVFVLVDCAATVEELSPEELLPWATRIASRYVAPGQAEAYGKRNAVAGELLVRAPLTKVIARKGIADW